jgi:hypothetical protein
MDLISQGLRSRSSRGDHRRDSRGTNRLGLRAEVADGTRLLIHGAIPPDLAEHIRDNKLEIIAALGKLSDSAVLAVASVLAPDLQQRIDAFRQQRREWREAWHPGEPFYVLLDAIEIKPGTCVSCGNDKGPRPSDMPPAAMHLRCRPCLQAVEIVLAEDR